MKKILLFFLVLTAKNLFCQTLLLYGGENNEVFLGCFTCNNYDKNSIWNTYGTYGSKYSSNSIWNKYGSFGGKYNMYSPFNNYATTPPILVDYEGNFYGYFTANRYVGKRTNNKLALYITDNWESITDNVGEFYKQLTK